jgi:subtilisin
MATEPYEERSEFTGRSMLTFRAEAGLKEYNDLVEFLLRFERKWVDRPIERNAEDYQFWPEYGVGLVPQSATQLADLAVGEFGVVTVEPERWFNAEVRHSQKAIDGTWGLEATRVLKSAATGKGVTVAVLDSGVASMHDAFKGRIVAGKFDSFVPNEPGIEDRLGHGTHIAGIVCGALPTKSGQKRYSIAPNAELLVARVLNRKGLGRGAWVLDGIRWAASKGAAVAVMAFGGAVGKGAVHDAWTQKVARTALNNGLFLVALAGNNSNASVLAPVNAPANCPSVMAVAAVDDTLKPSVFSAGRVNLDGEVNVAAPGESILSAWPPNTVCLLDGTSQAAAYAAGIAVLRAEGRAMTRGSALWTMMEQPGSVLAIGGGVNLVGRGLVQAP